MVISWSAYLRLWKNRHFWCDTLFFSLYGMPNGRQKGVFVVSDLSISIWKFLKNGRNMKIFLESCKERSKLSVDVFWSLRDHLVAQKSNFKKVFFENDVNWRKSPPLLTYLRDIRFFGFGARYKKKKIHNFQKQVSKLTSPWSQHEKWYITCLCCVKLGFSGFCRFFPVLPVLPKKKLEKNFLCGSRGTLPENFSPIGQVIL